MSWRSEYNYELKLQLHERIGFYKKIAAIILRANFSN